MGSQRRGRVFDSSMCHNKNTIGEEGNGEAPHKANFPREKLRALSLFSAMLKIEYTKPSRSLSQKKFSMVLVSLGYTASQAQCMLQDRYL